MIQASRVELLVISYFGSADLPRVVDDLLSQDHENWQLTVVDNSESEEEVALLQDIARRDGRVRIILPPANLGYFGGADFALRAISSAEAAAVIVSNVDLGIPQQSTLRDILRVASEVDSAMVLAPAILSERDGRDQNPLLTVRPSVREQATRRRRMASPALAQLTILGAQLQRAARVRATRSVAPRSSVYAAHGSFMIFLPSYFSAGGDFSHPIFLFGEELTVAERVRGMGGTIVYVPEIVIRHVEHGQMGVMRSRRVLREMVTAARYGHELIAGSHQ